MDFKKLNPGIRKIGKTLMDNGVATFESCESDLEDKKFDDLFSQKLEIGRPLVLAAREYAKQNITGGRDPRPDDIQKVLYPMPELHEKLRAHQEDNAARASRCSVAPMAKPW